MQLVSRVPQESTYRLKILGPTVLSWNGESLTMKGWGKRQPSLLRLLAASPGFRRPRDEVADLLWPDSPGDAALTNLRGAIHRLRVAAESGPVPAVAPVVLDGGWVMLNPACEWEVDLSHFTSLAASNDVAELEDAAGLLYGEPLVDDRYEDWASPVRERIDTQWRAVCLRLVEAYRESGQDEQALHWAERLLAHDPLDETANHRLLIELDRLGRHDEALRRYRAFAARLQEELDAPVSPETAALATSIEEHERQARQEVASAPLPRPRLLVVPAAEIEEESPAESVAIPAAKPRRPRARPFLALSPLLVAAVVFLALHFDTGSTAPRAAFVPVAGWGTVHPPPTLSFQTPDGIAADSAGDIYVADQFAGRVDKLSPTGTLLQSFRVPGGGTFLPSAVAVDAAGYLYAIDTGNASVRRFAPNGRLVATLPAAKMVQDGGALSAIAADGHGHLVVALQSDGTPEAVSVPAGGRSRQLGAAVFGVNPAALAAANGRIYAVDGSGADSVDGYTPSGTQVSGVPLPPLVAEAANAATGEADISVAVDRQGTIYIAVGGRVGGKTAAALFRRPPHPAHGPGWQTVPLPAGIIRSPAAVAVDGAGNLSLADLGGKVVVKLTPAGHLLAVWGSKAGTASAATPSGVAVDARGNVYEVDAVNGTVTKFSPAGIVLQRWGGPGSSLGLRLPQAIALDAAGNIYIADTGNNRIVKLSPAGTMLRRWGRTKAITGRLYTPLSKAANAGDSFSCACTAWRTGFAPLSVAVDRHDDLRVLNTGSPAVLVLNARGKQVTSWSPVSGDGGDYYGGIAVDGKGHVYITDGLDAGVTEYTRSGSPLHQWGGLGGKAGEYRAPAAVAVDPRGNVYVADTGNNRIQELSPRGSVLHVYGSPGRGYGHFAAPAGIAVDDHGDVYVADTGNHRVQKLLPAR